MEWQGTYFNGRKLKVKTRGKREQGEKGREEGK